LNKDDSKNVDRALKGDQQAYTELLNKYRGAIFNLVFKMIKNREEAEDLVQETFVKAFSALPSFDEQYAFSTWLFKIATNNCIDYLRKKKLKTFSIDKPTEAKEGEIKQTYKDAKTPDPEVDTIEKERSFIIEDAIKCLPAKYRDAIILRHKEDKSYEEISEILNLPIGTVKARIFRAREKLKKYLKKRMFF